LSEFEEKLYKIEGIEDTFMTNVLRLALTLKRLAEAEKKEEQKFEIALKVKHIEKSLKNREGMKE
jgi:hypothetical protein